MIVCVCVGVYRVVTQMKEIEMEKIKIAFRSMPIKRDQSDEANDIIEKAKDIRWLEELRLPTCNECKHLIWNRTIKQTLKRTYICGILFNVIITCEILEEDIDKPVKCPFFEEGQFEKYR